MTTKEWRKNNLDKGLCVCGHNLDGKYKSCIRCRQYNKDWWRAHPEKLRAKWRKANIKRGRQYYRDYTRARQLDIKQEVFDAYGNECTCCGETIPEFLQVDHIDGGGCKHRVEVLGGKNRGGHAFYKWLKDQGFPKDNFQLLCANCNFAKGRFKVCPHNRELNVTEA